MYLFMDPLLSAIRFVLFGSFPWPLSSACLISVQVFCPLCPISVQSLLCLPSLISPLPVHVCAFGFSFSLISPLPRGGDLGGTWGDGPPKLEVGDGPCIRPPNILRSS